MFEYKEKYQIDDLVKIVELLRMPGGCPWDAEQTHKSIRANFIEETYEAIEAIDNDDKVLLREELGDVLLQVVFHTQMEREIGSFELEDVITDICNKLIVRHPHVFGDVVVKDSAQVLSNWDEIKKKTKGQKSQSESMISVSKALPSLMRAQAIQKKASKVGFDWDNIFDVLDKLEEEVRELREAAVDESREKQEEELGDVLFSAVNVSRFIGTDAESVLYNSNEKFIERFRKVEELASKRGIDVRTAGLDTLDALWEEIKTM